MLRLDFQSVIVLGVAMVASFSTALVIRQFDGGGAAIAAPAAVVEAPAEGRAAQVVRGPDGHYWAQAKIDGHAVHLLVDTGASVVALTRADAQRLGVDPAPEAFTGQVQTASGTVRAAPVKLESVSVAGARVDQVEALVVEAGLTHSLLGMSFLGRLSAFEATPAGLTLRP
jgi:aspartyl protease family protein